MARSRASGLLLVILTVLPASSRAQAPAREPLTVMSFNIRYGTAKDGENEWERRRDDAFDLIREQDADLIGLQEALHFQIDEIVAAVPGYATIGVGRDDGRARGEFAAILFRKNRFRVAEAGTFWFSDTPHGDGFEDVGNNITRICTWARLIDRDGRGFFVYNVHLDHQSQPSRERSTAAPARANRRAIRRGRSRARDRRLQRRRENPAPDCSATGRHLPGGPPAGKRSGRSPASSR